MTGPLNDGQPHRPDPLPDEAEARERQALGRQAESDAEGGAGRPLVIPQLTLPPTSTDSRRRRRQAANQAQLLITHTCSDMPEAARIIQCGRATCNQSGVVVKRSVNGYIYGSGIITCGSPWVCLRCSYKIRSKRARHTGTAVAGHLALGGGVLFGTFTMSHDRGERLDKVWTILSDGWAFMTAGRQWVNFKADFGLLGSIKTVEVTHGANGWHPHLHVLFFVDEPMNDFDRDDIYREFRRHLRTRWTRRLSKKHGRNVSHEFGTRFDPVKADESDKIGIYCTKVGYELAMADSKIGRTEGQRHPFAIAHDAANNGDKADIALLREWITGSKRKRSIHWSGPEIKAYVTDQADKTDDELAQEEQVGDEALLVVEKHLWRRIIGSSMHARTDFLEVFEDGGDTFDAIYYLAGIGITAEIDDNGPLATLRLDNTTNPNDRRNHVTTNHAH